jgi:hypothetical protein
MKYVRLLIPLLLLSYNLYSAEMQSIDPFAYANALYDEGNWTEAYKEFTDIHANISSGTINKENIKQADLICGHVNYGDVTFAIAATQYAKNNIDNAKELMRKACQHWSHRLKGSLFGRIPLNNEWLVGQDIAGKILIVFSERVNGAFGDSFYASWLLEWAKEQGAIIIFIPQKPLAKLYDKQCLPNTLQAQYIDQVALRDTELPHHDKTIYLWSLLEHCLHNNTIEKPFPVRQCLSGTNYCNENLNKKIIKLTQLYGHTPFLVGGWWRSSANKAFDNGYLDRDPGAHKILSTIQELPVLFINLEGLGRIPLSKEKLEKRKAKGTAGNSDDIDVTTYPTRNVFNFDPNFDKEIPFGDTINIMQMIKKEGGILIGCDTGLCNAAAMVSKNKTTHKEKSVFVILNKKADFRWSDDITSPREWHHSDDVLIFQAQKQGEWDKPLIQARNLIEHRIGQFLNRQ